jgi:hypothetical protein
VSGEGSNRAGGVSDVAAPCPQAVAYASGSDSLLTMRKHLALLCLVCGCSADEPKYGSLGADSLLILPDSGTLTLQDADAVARDCPAVIGAAPVLRRRMQVTFASKNWVPLYIYGTTPSFLDVRQWTDLEEGEPFTDADVRDAARSLSCSVRDTTSGQAKPTTSASGTC